MTDKDYLENLAIDTPDSRDYPAEEYIDMAMGLDVIQRPEKKVKIRDQGQVGACTRFASTHGNNGQNILEYEKNGQEYTQLDPMDVRNRGNKSLTLMSALTQLKTEGLIAGRVAIEKYPKDKAKAIQCLKQAIDMGNFVFTGSDNGNWGLTGKSPYIYILRTDGKIVGHAWLIVGYDDETQLFKCANSWGSKRGDKGYFYLRYEDIDKIFTKYPMIDKDDSGKFAIFKRKQKAKELINECSEFWKGETSEETQNLLHLLAQKLRIEYNIEKVA